MANQEFITPDPLRLDTSGGGCDWSKARAAASNNKSCRPFVDNKLTSSYIFLYFTLNQPISVKRTR